MAKVRDIMTTDVPQIDSAASVLDAVNLMNEKRMSGVVVSEGGKPAGMFTDRSLLRRFAILDRKPSEVRVSEVMAPLLKISTDAPVKDAAKLILENSFTRVAVFEGDKLVGWLTLTDIARASSKKSALDHLRRENTKFADEELICPECRSAVMVRVVAKSQDASSGERIKEDLDPSSQSQLKLQGRELLGGGAPVLRWECPNCGHEE